MLRALLEPALPLGVGERILKKNVAAGFWKHAAATVSPSTPVKMGAVRGPRPSTSTSSSLSPSLAKLFRVVLFDSAPNVKRERRDRAGKIRAPLPPVTRAIKEACRPTEAWE
jgi:hypothetical protein